MPKARPIIASFWVIRDAEHPEAESRNYPGQLRILQGSCDRLGLKHVVLTDHATMADARWPEGIEGWPIDLPQPLMMAATAATAAYLESGPNQDVLFCGADSIVLRNPVPPRMFEADLCLTLRPGHEKYPINSGYQYIRRDSVAKVAAVYRDIASRTGVKWCDDQIAMQEVLAPMPRMYGAFNRRGLRVAFVPMKPWNVRPKSELDPALGAVLLHFRGKAMKQLMFAWAKRHGYA